MSVVSVYNSLNDSSYRESIEFSANFNRRLCSERRMRLPFLDPQTGVAQKHSALFMDRRQRMPGFREGQLYSYPAARWRKSRRQYLTKTQRPFGSIVGAAVAKASTSGTTPIHSGSGASKRMSGVMGASGGDASNASLASGGDATDSNDFSGLPSFLDADSSLGGGADTSDSKDSQQNTSSSLKEDLPKEWFYDDMDMHEIDALEEPKSPADDEYDYDPRYGHTKKKKKRKPAAPKKAASSHHVGEGGRKGGRQSAGSSSGLGTTPKGRGGRRKNAANTRKDKLTVEPPSPSSIIEPPSFEMAAAAVNAPFGSPGLIDSLVPPADMRSYRKYL